MIAVGAGTAAVLARFVPASIMETLNQDYVRTARAKGLRERSVVMRHAMRNALIPVITVAALQIGFLISGAGIVEVVFARPGFGSLLIDGVVGRDINSSKACSWCWSPSLWSSIPSPTSPMGSLTQESG